jgi:hypothetical protein
MQKVIKKILIHTPRNGSPWVHFSIVKPLLPGSTHKINLPTFKCLDIPKEVDISDLDGIAKWVGEQVKGDGWEVDKEVDVILVGLVGKRWWGNGVPESVYMVVEKCKKLKN